MERDDVELSRLQHAMIGVYHFISTALLSIVALVMLAYLYVLIRDRPVSWRRFFWRGCPCPLAQCSRFGFWW